MFAPNVKLYIPCCCTTLCQERDFSDRLSKAFKTIQTTRIGRQILDDIAACDQGFTVYLMTHSLFEDHAEWIGRKKKKLSAKADDLQASCDLKKGSGSTIYFHPEIEDHLPRCYTQWHYNRCVKTLLVSESCGHHQSPCNQSSSFVEVLFHELVHARNNLYGENKRNIKDVARIYRNREEYDTIKIENIFRRELSLQGQRWGHQGPESSLQKRILDLELFSEPQEGLHHTYEGYRSYSSEQKEFLTTGAPQIIAGIGASLKTNTSLYVS